MKSAQERMQRLADKMREAIAKMEQTLKLGDLVTPEMQEKVAGAAQAHAEKILDKDMKAPHGADGCGPAQDRAGRTQGHGLKDAQKMQRKFVDELKQTLALLKRAKLEADNWGNCGRRSRSSRSARRRRARPHGARRTSTGRRASSRRRSSRTSRGTPRRSRKR